MTTRMEQFLASGSKPAPPMMNGNTPWAHAYAQHIKGVVHRQAARAPRSQQVHLGPSELGVACDRQVVGKLLAGARTNHVADPWPSVLGTAAHAWLADAFAADDPLRWLTEHRVTPHPEHAGTGDLYDAVTATVGDHKVLGESSMDKVRADGGPPRHYKRQLALYGLGFLREGWAVQRIALIAYPRTKASLDTIYVWEHAFDDEVVSWLADTFAETDRRKYQAGLVRSGRWGLADVPREPSRDECYFCVTGDTEVVTSGGIKPIRDIVGTAALLVPESRAPSRGGFKTAPVRYFGDQQTYTVTMRRYKAVKTVTTTADHRWFDHLGTEVRTKELTAGTKLSSSSAEPVRRSDLVRVAAAQGFVFGDGTVPQGNRPATLNIYKRSNKTHLKDLFDTTWHEYADRWWSYHIPRSWKRTPPIDESRSFLLSWLAGYFAADGNVHSGQAVLSSAVRSNIYFARDVAAICGVRYGLITERQRVGFGTVATPLYSMTLDVRDLPGWFLLIPSHRANAQFDRPRRVTHWSVVSVEPTGLTEPVYCATDVDRFVLADGVVTGNCPFYRPGTAHDGTGIGCPGTVTK